MDQGRAAQNMVPTPASMIYLESLEPVNQCGPGQQGNGPGEEDSPEYGAYTCIYDIP
jgi:hypothetical protein